MTSTTPGTMVMTTMLTLAVAVTLTLAAVMLGWSDGAGRLWRVARGTGTRRRPLVTVAQLLAGVVVAGCVWLAGALILGPLTPLAAVGAGVAAAWFQPRLEPGRQRARNRVVARDLPVTLELMASCLDAGAPLRRAVEQVALIGPPSTAATLRQVDDAVRLGVHEPDAWGRLADDPVWGAVAADLTRCAETGATASDVLREHAAEGRRTVAATRLAAARAVGVRTVLPLMTCFLPAFLLVGVVPIVASLVPRLLHHQ